MSIFSRSITASKPKTIPYLLRSGDVVIDLETSILFPFESAASSSLPITLRQTKFGTNTSGTTLSVTFDSVVSAGNLIVVRAATNDPTITIDTAGYTQAIISDNAADGDTCGIWFKVATGGETTVQISTAGNTKHLHIAEYSGLTSTPLDVVASSTPSTSVTTKDTGTTGTLSQANELIVTVLAIRADATSESTSSPFTIDELGNGTFSSIFTSFISSSTTTQTPTSSWTTAGTAWGATATFLATPTGGGTTFTKDVFGNLVIVGNLFKTTQKILTGVTTPSSNLFKSIFKTIIASIIVAGALNKLISRILIGSISLSSLLNKFTSKTFTATTVISGSLSQAIVFTIGLSGLLTATGSLFKQTNKTLSSTISLVSSVSKQTNKFITATINISSNVLKNISRLLQSQIVSFGTLTSSFSVNKLVNGVISLAGSLSTLFIGGGSGTTIIGRIKPFIRRYTGRR